MSAAELFAGAGQSPGVEIWRIEAMKPVKQTDVTSGKFFSGDSYIVLHTFTERTGQIAMNAHFWLGSESSQDERGAAALLTVELDQFLDEAVQSIAIKLKSLAEGATALRFCLR